MKFVKRQPSKWRLLALVAASMLITLGHHQYKQQQVVFVMGMHHSMTSVATKLLLDTQMFYGGELEDLLIHRNNPLKYWELRKCVKANQAAFQQQQTTGGRKGLYNWIGYGFDLEQGNNDVLQSNARTVLQEMQSKTQTTKPLVIKDPRLSLTIRTWLEQAQAIGLLPVCVVLVRDPIETAYRFLTDYRVLSAREWANVWEQYTFQALRSCYELNVAVHIVHHEDYALDPVRTTTELALGLLTKPIPAIDFSIADSWKLKHKRKQAVWSNAKPNLLLKETSLLSPQGQALAQALETGDLNKVRDLALNWKPAWLPLPPTSNLKVFTCEVTAMRNAKVLIRSIYAFDATTLLYAWGEYALAHKYELRELGWLVCAQAADLSCVSEAITIKQALDPHSLAVQYSGDQFTFARCLVESSCEHEKLFQAYEVIGGQVSAEII